MGSVSSFDVQPVHFNKNYIEKVISAADTRKYKPELNGNWSGINEAKAGTKTLEEVCVNGVVEFDLTDGEDKLVWQQMPIHFLYNLLDTGSFYFKNITAFSDDDERKLDWFYREMDEKSRPSGYSLPDKEIQTMVREFTKNVYVSCWYRSDNLTNIVFREYAKNSSGVAVGIKMGQLVNYFKNHPKNGGRIYYGPTLYLDDNFTQGSSWAYCPEDVIAPFFFKSENHNDDKEFRLIWVRDSLMRNAESKCGILATSEELSGHMSESETGAYFKVVEKKSEKEWKAYREELNNYSVLSAIYRKENQIYQDKRKKDKVRSASQFKDLIDRIAIRQEFGYEQITELVRIILLDAGVIEKYEDLTVNKDEMDGFVVLQIK